MIPLKEVFDRKRPVLKGVFNRKSWLKLKFQILPYKKELLWIVMELSNVEGDELVDRSNSQASYNIGATYFVWISHEHNSLPLEPIKPIWPLSMDVFISYFEFNQKFKFCLTKGVIVYSVCCNKYDPFC